MQYSYIAVDSSSTKQKGLIEANTKKEVIDFLRASKLTPLQIKEVTSVSQGFRVFNKVSNTDVVVFTRQLASMITTGLTLIEALRILKDQSNKPQMQKVIDDLIAKVSEGNSFSKALSMHRDVFSDVYIALIRAAESGGLLDKILSRLADNLEQGEDIKKHVKSAMFYPMIIVVGVIAVITIMNIFVIPQLGSLYEGMGLELPWSTKLVLGFSKLFTNFFPVVIIGIIAVFFGYKRYQKTTSGRKVIDTVKLKIPIMGDILTLSVLDEIARTLSLLISSGTSILEALTITSQVANNVLYRDAIKDTSMLVEKGVNMSTAFENQQLFPQIFVQMVKVGESTGKIDEGLMKVADYFERDLNLKIKTLTTSIEPILIIVLGVSVAFLIMSVITPIYSLITQIQ